jgi:hypothetical protein
LTSPGHAGFSGRTLLHGVCSVILTRSMYRLEVTHYLTITVTLRT